MNLSSQVIGSTRKINVVDKRVLIVLFPLLFGMNAAWGQCSDINFDCPNFDLIVDLAVDTAGNLNLCEGEPLTFLNQTSDNLGAIDSFVWIWNYLGDPTISQDCNVVGGTEPISHIYSFEDSVICTRPNQDFVILSVGLSAIDTNGCYSLVQSNEILVNIKPRALFAVTQQICEGENIQFINQSCPVTDNISFFWESFPDGQTSDQFTPDFQYDEPGTYTVTLTVNTPICGFEDTYSLDFEVLPYPEPDYTILNPALGDSLCAGFDTLIVANNSVHQDSVRWEVYPAADVEFVGTGQGGDTAYIVFNAEGDYTIVLNVLNQQCASDTSFQFSVAASQFLELTDLPACVEEAEFDLANYIETPNGVPTDYSVVVTELATGAEETYTNTIPATITFDQTGSYEIAVVSQSICGTIAQTGSISYLPAIQWVEPDVLCGDSDTTINLNGLLVDRPPVCLRWAGEGVFNDSLFNPSVVGEGFYTVSVTDCDTLCIGATLELLVIGPTLPLEDIVICVSSNPFPLDSLLEGAWSGPAVVGDVLDPSITGPGTYPVYFMSDIDASCVVQDTIQVFIEETVQADFTVNTPNCADSLFQFDNDSGADVIQWYFGDGSVSQENNPQHQYDTSGTYYVSLVVGSEHGGCRDSTAQEVIVQSPPDASFDVTIDSVGCDSINITLQALPSNAFLDFEWTINGNQILFGDSVVATIEALDTSREITVELLAGNSCGNVLVSQPIFIPPGFVAGLTYDSEIVKCPGEPINFINISNNVDSFIIDYGNGMVVVNEVIDTSFTNETDTILDYELTIYGYNASCGWDTGRIVVPVRPALVVASALYDEQEVCEGDEVNFVNNSFLQDETILFFGDGASAIVEPDDTIRYTYSDAGQYSPVVIAVGCGTDTNYLDPITVYGLPDFAIQTIPSIPCAGTSVLLINSGSSINPVWMLEGDTIGNFVDSLVYMPTMPGTFKIVLSAQSAGNNFCQTTDTFLLTVGAAADLTVIADPVTGCAPLDVSVQLSSNSNGVEFQTSFGNQQVGSGNVVNTIYSTPGTYDLMAMATNADGCSNDTLIQVEVLEEYTAEAYGDSIILIGESTLLDFTVNQDYESFTWSAAGIEIGTNTVRPLEQSPVVSTLYSIEVIGSAENCIDQDQILVRVECDELFLPDAFSPNEDGANDGYGLFRVFEDYRENTRTSCIEVTSWAFYNRWGERIFAADDMEARWDGRFKGETVGAGIYILLVEYVDAEGFEKSIQKEVYVLK